MTEPIPDSSDFIAPLLLQTPQPSIDYRQGVILEWNPVAGTNRVNVGGGILENLAVITDSNLVGLRAGDVVALLKYNNSYAILGRIQRGVSVGTPWQPVPLYQAFNRNAVNGATSVNVGALVSWESYIYPTHHTHVELIGTFGQLTGANTTVFNVVAAGTVIGTWTEAGTLSTSRHGPFSVAPYIHLPWVPLTLTIASSVGAGTVAFHPIACFLRTLA